MVRAKSYWCSVVARFVQRDAVLLEPLIATCTTAARCIADNPHSDAKRVQLIARSRDSYSHERTYHSIRPNTTFGATEAADAGRSSALSERQLSERAYDCELQEAPGASTNVRISVKPTNSKIACTAWDGFMIVNVP